MKIRWPGLREVARELWEFDTKQAHEQAARLAAELGGSVVQWEHDAHFVGHVRELRTAYEVIAGDLERDLVIVAPHRLAWLYRYLPLGVAWHWGAGELPVAPYFLFAAWSGRWRIGWLPTSRSREIAWFGILVLNDRRIVL